MESLGIVNQSARQSLTSPSIPLDTPMFINSTNLFARWGIEEHSRKHRMIAAFHQFREQLIERSEFK